MSNRNRRSKDSSLLSGLQLVGTDPRNKWSGKKPVKKTTAPTPSPKQQEVGGAGSPMDASPIPIQLPLNFAPPVGAETVDIRRLKNINPGAVEELLLSFTADTSQAMGWYKYGIFTDALDASLVEFIPRVNKQRVLRYHGDPDNNFKLDLSIGPNLTDDSMIYCWIPMKPGDTLTWHVTNNDNVINPMGVRMSGYVDLSLKRKSLNFGG